jgi:hypothetical protein
MRPDLGLGCPRHGSRARSPEAAPSEHQDKPGRLGGGSDPCQHNSGSSSKMPSRR